MLGDKCSIIIDSMAVQYSSKREAYSLQNT